MPARQRSRQRALQVLFQLDVRKMLVWTGIDDFYETLHTAEHEGEESPKRPERDGFMETLVRGTVEYTTEIDRKLSQFSENWRIERMPAVDRNILRMAVYEMTKLDTPPPVVIDQALELARQFSGEESVPFINGILDAIRKQHAKPASI